jgi:hypothetical protein
MVQKMKRTQKKTRPLTEKQTEQKITKGGNISIYLNAENLRYLDELGKLFGGKGRSETISLLLSQMRLMAQMSTVIFKGQTPPGGDIVKQTLKNLAGSE